MLCPGSSEVTNFVQVQSTDDTTLVISWEPPVTPNGNITSYSVNITNLRDRNTVRRNIETVNITQTSLGRWKINTLIHIYKHTKHRTWGSLQCEYCSSEQGRSRRVQCVYLLHERIM